jgi:hypothetical protein
MSKGKKATTQPKNRNAVHKHGGNRAGSHAPARPRRSSQTAGKDPHRGSSE